MSSQSETAVSWSRITAAVLLALSAAAIFLCADAEPVILIADRPLPVAGTSLVLPAAAFHFAIPILITLGHRLLARQEAFGPWIQRLLTIVATVAVGCVWLADLVRHDGWLSLVHCALILVILLPPKTRSPAGLGWYPMAVAGPMLAVVSYGAVWGETRCDEPSCVRCRVEEGPRILVPEILQRLGVPVFADLRQADLSGLSLRGRDLRYADLGGSDLRGADLTGANLRRAILDDVQAVGSKWHDAYLDGGSMARADLRNADLLEMHAYRVNLRGADLSGANLDFVNLSHADLSRTRFDGATLRGTYLRFTEGLTQLQLDQTCGDRDTLLPAGRSLSVCAGP